MKRFLTALSVLLALIVLTVPLSALSTERVTSDASDVLTEEIADILTDDGTEERDASGAEGDYLTEGILTGVAVILVAVFMLAIVFFGVVIMKTGVRKK